MKKTENTKNIEYYLSLPYTTVLKKDEDGDILARIEELDGCVSHGSDESEAISNLKAMQTAWIEACLESGRPVPEPEPEEELPSGKYLQRIPRTLHLRLIRRAKREGVSLNALTTTMLTDAESSKLVGDLVAEKLSASLVCDPKLNIVAQITHGHHENWGQIPHWILPDYVNTPGIVHKANRVMALMVPASKTEEIDKDANKKEAIAFGYAHHQR
jgi:predicted RNase H-like HicB family nuclease